MPFPKFFSLEHRFDALWAHKKEIRMCKEQNKPIKLPHIALIRYQSCLKVEQLIEEQRIKIKVCLIFGLKW